MKTYKVHCVTRDSLGEIVAEYDTQLNQEAYSQLMSIAYEDPESGALVAIKDLPVDDELGSREYYLTK